jgi:hypothetical protein
MFEEQSEVFYLFVSIGTMQYNAKAILSCEIYFQINLILKSNFRFFCIKNHYRKNKFSAMLLSSHSQKILHIVLHFYSNIRQQLSTPE